MHIPDGFIDPKISFGLMGAAVAALSYSLAKVKATLTSPVAQRAFALAGRGMSNLTDTSRRALSSVGEQKIYKMGMVAALVFAAQMFNFPVASGTSGHLIGAVLAAVLLGPFAGLLTISVVVIVQALFFADGGLIVMGANIVNLAVIPVLTGFFVYSWAKRYMLEWQSIFAAAWLSVMLAALAASLEIGLSGTVALSSVLSAMLKVHAVIGLAEGLITVALVNLFRKLLPAREL